MTTINSQNSEPEWDQLSIDTPELVSLDMPVAGLGSRFVALLVDYTIWLVVLIIIVVIVALVDPSLSHFSKIGQKWANAILVLVPFLFLWGYFTLFEAFWNGRTPGKYVAKIRVIQISGRGIGLFESMTRNIVRFVDQFPGVYAVGAVCVFLTARHQRLGDMAAGTLVVHERERLDSPAISTASSRTVTAGLFSPLSTPLRPLGSASIPATHLERLNHQDLEVLEGFFARRLDFSMETRLSLATRITDAISTKAGLERPPDISDETFLEQIARQLRDQARMR